MTHCIHNCYILHMALFQKSILAKYLAPVVGSLHARFEAYSAYFLNEEIQKNILRSKEEQFQEGFLRELFVKILGYTINPEPTYNLTTEYKNTTDSRKADGAILLEGSPVGVIELKDHKTRDLRDVETQAFSYKSKHKGIRYVVISNFERLRFYIDDAVDCEEFDLFNLTEREFEKLYLLLSFESVKKGVPLEIKGNSKSEEKSITDALYKDYSAFKRELFADICNRNAGVADKLTLFRKTQKLLDRLLFIFFAEDRGLVPPNIITKVVEDVNQLRNLDMDVSLYERFKKYFGYLDKGKRGKDFEIFAYNGGLFRPDTLLDSLEIDDTLLEEHSLRLSAYDFESDVSVDILGHIFEHSLSEIEEIEGGEKKNSKRKKDGVFYTPAYITRYIVENTLGTLCRQKKRELHLVEDSAERPLGKRKREETVEALDAYRKWLLSLKICDPACGSGAFLNAVLEFLIQEHREIDNRKARLFEERGKIQMALSDIDLEILENNIYGVDINEESVEIAKLSLWLHTARPGRKLSDLSENIKCGNSLIDDPAVAHEKAFDWKKEFPEVFGPDDPRRGFDVIIGNPPYVDASELKKTYSSEEYDFLKKNYDTAKGTVDLYIYFFENGLNLLRQNGLLSFITPNRYLSASYGKALREYILMKKTFYQLVDYSDKKVFQDASTYPVITFIKNGKEKQDVLCGKFDDDHNLISKKYPNDKLNVLDDSILGFLLNDKLPITQKIVSQSVSLTSVGKINATSTAKEADEYSEYITETSSNGYKLINTGTIDPYVTMWGYTPLVKQGKRFTTPYLPKDEKGISENRHTLYSSAKIIISKIGLTCESFFDKKGEYASIDTNCIHSFSEKYLPEYVLCFLNSKLYNYMFECFFDGLRMSGGYLLYSAPNLKNTYIKEIAVENQKIFVDFADQMLALNAELLRKRSKFLHRIRGTFAGIKITATLEKFDGLEFRAFAAELKKQKIKLTLSAQDEWEEYFDSNKKSCNEISAQIAEIDDKINAEVYKLYGLTPEEIATVENLG